MICVFICFLFFFSSRRRHTRFKCDWSSDVCSSDLEKAQIGQTEVRVGIMPGYGGNVRLMRLIGPGRAKEMIYTGKIVNAVEAERIGLVNRVVPHGKLMEEAMTMAWQIA